MDGVQRVTGTINTSATNITLLEEPSLPTAKIGNGIF
jgi:hypothetical protein